MARTDLTQGNSTGNAATYSTASITPAPKGVTLAFVMNVRSGFGQQAAEPTAQGNGMTWTQVTSVQVSSAANRRLTCFRATGMPAPGPVRFDFSGEQQALCAWSVFEYDGVTDIGQFKTASGGTPMPTITLDTLADADKSVVVGGVIVNSLFGAPPQVQPGQGLAEIHEQDVSDPGIGGSLQTEDRTGGGSTVNWTASSQGWAAIGLELTAGLDVDDVAALAKRFEPILYFHAAEKFFPSNAKRYIEKCALWRAQSKFDVKDSWGGKGAPFPRAPLIDYMGIAAVTGEPGTFLGDNLINTPAEERFLDLSGWKDASGMDEPKVTAASKNIYSNRGAVATRYDSGDLADSKYWHHVEFFDNARLRRLLSTVRAPNLVKVLDSLKKDAALLCYYFFFPAHEEGPIPGCTNVEAIEFGGFAGEWACMALLLEKDADAKFAPSFIGLSGRGTYQTSPPFPPRGQASDSDDMALRSDMIVLPYSTPEKISEHPKVFVANGTHSLYPMAGTFVVDYKRGAPGQCGLVEGNDYDPNADDSSVDPAGIFGLKLLATGMLGSVLGPVLSPVALAVGALAAELEGVWPPHGVRVLNTIRPAPDDVTGPPGSGKVVRPENLAVPDGGSDLQNWLSKPGATIGGKPYEFLVDRDKQPWWPSDLGVSGYQGLWGPRVENDPFARRAGMRFPTFWRTFFLAVANGKAWQTLRRRFVSKDQRGAILSLGVLSVRSRSFAPKTPSGRRRRMSTSARKRPGPASQRSGGKCLE